MASYQQARQIQETLVAETPEETTRLESLGNTLTAIGRTLQRQRELQEAQATHDEATAIRRRLVALAPAEGEFHRMLANSIMHSGIVDFEAHRPKEARAKYDEAQAQRQQALALPFDSPELQRDLGIGHYNLARLAASQDDLASATEDFRKATLIFEKLLKTRPRDLENQSRLIVCYRVLADLVSKKEKKQGDSALELYQKALRLMERLAWANPDVPDYQFDLARLLMNLGLLHHDRAEADAELTSYQRALDVLEAIVDQYPDVARYREEQVQTLWAIFTVLRKQDKPAARKHLEAAKKQLTTLIQQSPNNKQYPAQLGRIQSALAQSE
jgi:tetratricopeptide (TPR) repeat protein